MTEAALTITYAAASGSTGAPLRSFVHLEQVLDQPLSVTVADIQQMVHRAKSGLSARTYKRPGCPLAVVDGTVEVYYTVLSWPSAETLDYTVTVAGGEVADPVRIEEETELSLLFGLTATVELGHILRDMTVIGWETPCYTDTGAETAPPSITMPGPTVVLASAPVFGVVRIRGVRVGYRHEITARLVDRQDDKPTAGEYAAEDNGGLAYDDFIRTYYPDSQAEESGEPINLTGYSVTNLQLTATARWLDDHGDEQTETLDLETAQCAADLLEACGDGSLIQSLCLGHAADRRRVNVYVDGCRGRVIAAIPETEDDNSWCGRD